MSVWKLIGSKAVRLSGKREMSIRSLALSGSGASPVQTIDVFDLVDVDSVLFRVNWRRSN